MGRQTVNHSRLRASTVNLRPAIGRHSRTVRPVHDGSNRSLNAEWVTVKNTGRHAVNLTGWTLTSRHTHATYRFHLRLGGYRQVRVRTGRGHDTMRDVYQDRRTYAWDNHRDTAVLRNDHRLVVDTKHWGRP